MPSAFIPFCSFGTDMKILGEYMDNLTFPVCNKFTPTILDGELCYELDTKTATGREIRSANGQRGGLMLMLDYNVERVVKSKTSMLPTKQKPSDLKETKMDLDIVPNAKEAAAKIFIHLLTSNVGYGSGKYVMKALKNMVVSDDFLRMDYKYKKCSVDVLEKCQLETFIKQGASTCGCEPAALAPAWPSQVTRLPGSLQRKLKYILLCSGHSS